MLFVATSSICLDINLVSIFRPAIFQLLEEECFLYSLGQPSQGQLYSVCFLFPSFTNHIRGEEWENTVFLWVTILPRVWLYMLSFGAHFLWHQGKSVVMERGAQEIKEGWRPSEVPSWVHKSLCLTQRFPCRDLILKVIPGKGNKGQGRRNRKRRKSIQRCVIKLSTAADKWIKSKKYESIKKVFNLINNKILKQRNFTSGLKNWQRW